MYVHRVAPLPKAIPALTPVLIDEETDEPPALREGDRLLVTGPPVSQRVGPPRQKCKVRRGAPAALEPPLSWAGAWRRDATYGRNHVVAYAASDQVETQTWRADCDPDATLQGVVPMDGTEWKRLLPPESPWAERPPRTSRPPLDRIRTGFESLDNPGRLREGALSPLATPSSPPAEPHLTPLDDGIELERETRLGPDAPAGEPLQPMITWRGPWDRDATYHRNDAVIHPPPGRFSSQSWRADCPPDATLRSEEPGESAEWTRLLPPGVTPDAPLGADPWRMPALERGRAGFERAETPEKPPLWDPADIVYHNRPPWADLSVFTIATAIIASIAFALALVALMYG